MAQRYHLVTLKHSLQIQIGPLAMCADPSMKLQQENPRPCAR